MKKERSDLEGKSYEKKIQGEKKKRSHARGRRQSANRRKGTRDEMGSGVGSRKSIAKLGVWQGGDYRLNTWMAGGQKITKEGLLLYMDEKKVSVGAINVQRRSNTHPRMASKAREYVGNQHRMGKMKG